MVKIILRSLITLACFIFSTCTTNQTKVEDTTAFESTDSLLSTPLSLYHLPITYPLSDFKKLVNETLKEDFLSKGIYINEKKDSLHVTLKKNKDIDIQIKQNKMFYYLALHAECYYQIKVLGVPVKNNKPVEADFTLILTSTPTLDKYWKIHPQLSLVSLEWQNTPEVDLGLFKISISQIVENLLTENEAELTEQLNTLINKEVDLKKPILKIWKDIQKPVALYKEKTDTLWMKSGGEEVSASILLNKEQYFVFDINVKASTKIGFNKEDLPNSSIELPALNIIKESSDDFDVSIGCLLQYESINRLLNEKLNGSTVKKAGYEITIKNIDLYSISNTVVGITLLTSGDINGEIYLKGTPIYDHNTKSTEITNISYTLNSNNTAINKAGEALSPYVIEFISPFLQLNIKEYIDQLPTLITQEVNKGKTGQIAHLEIHQMELKAPLIHFTKEGIQLLVNIKGNADLSIKTLLPSSL